MLCFLALLLMVTSGICMHIILSFVTGISIVDFLLSLYVFRATNRRWFSWNNHLY